MKKISFVIMLLIAFGGHCQQEVLHDSIIDTPCKKQTKYLRILLSGSSIIEHDPSSSLSSLTNLADSGCVRAQLELGKMYKNGKYIAANEDLAFKYTKLAADQNYPNAISKLGTLYQRGIGCPLSYEQAIALYKKADELGDDGTGAYYLGYNYFKGLGPVEQDYTKAFQWFSLSDHPMAKHFLGLMYYFGYGVSINKTLAYELLANNTSIKNSTELLSHIEKSKNVQESILSNYSGMDVKTETEKINSLLEVENETFFIEEESNKIEASDLDGNWVGKLVELDWSGERILRMLPATFKLEKAAYTDAVKYNAQLEDNSDSGEAILLDESLYFDDLYSKFSRIYTDEENVSHLRYKILNTNVKLKTVNHIKFMVGYLETKVLDWNEPGPPMLLVLVNDKVLTDNGVEISHELIEALIAEQDNNFITLYPNPFKDDLLIQYELAQESTASVEIYNLDGTYSQIIAKQQVQNAGKQLFQYNGSNLGQGIYIIRVIANGTTYTKLILKEN